MSGFFFRILDASSDGASAPFSPEDFLNKLFPNFWSWLINFLALIVLFVAVYFIAYKPLKKLSKKRGDYVEGNLRDSERAKAISERKAQEADASVSAAKKEASEIVAKAKSDAAVSAAEIKAQAEQEAIKRQDEATKAIALEEEKSKEAIHQEIVNVALDASKQVLGREVNEKDNAKLVDDFVKDQKEKSHE
jgi:F-type H+-transporting ATPase subunit b